MRDASHEFPSLQGAHDLGGHHRVGTGVPGHAGLREGRVVVGEGGDAGEEDELHRREAERREGGTLTLLPAVGGLPEEEAWALAGRGEEARESFRHWWRARLPMRAYNRQTYYMPAYVPRHDFFCCARHSRILSCRPTRMVRGTRLAPRAR